MTLVVGTAGHIDHGKTTLLRALTGIDADRLPEERRRGMTIDVGYAHLDLEDGSVIDFVDVPGHDKLIGNMLVGAGEIDAALLVIAADDGPRAQTLEHLALLDALDIRHGLAVITKIDVVDDERVEAVARAVRGLLAPTSLAGSPVIVASGTSGVGLTDVRAAAAALRDAVPASNRPPTLAIDRVFTIKGRGAVVTGTLRGGPLSTGDTLRLVPGGRDVRIREIQVRGSVVARTQGSSRTALNLAGIGMGDLRRGDVLTADPEVRATDRVLAAFRRRVADRTRARLHAGTSAVDAEVGRSGRDALDLADGTPVGIVRLAGPIGAAPGDRFVLRRGPGQDPVGGILLDVAPPRGISRRRQTPDRVGRLAAALSGSSRDDVSAARLDLHGTDGDSLAPDVAETGVAAALAAADPEATLVAVRDSAARALRRVVTIRRDTAAAVAASLVDDVVASGRLLRDADRLRLPGTTSRAAEPDPASIAAMDRLVTALDVPAPPPLDEAARTAGCAAPAVRALVQAGRIVVIAPDIAYAAATYRELVDRATGMAATAGPLTPAALRDATGTSRKYVMAILEDLDRRGLLRRTPAGHVPGPKAERRTPATTPTTPAVR